MENQRRNERGKALVGRIPKYEIGQKVVVDGKIMIYGPNGLMLADTMEDMNNVLITGLEMLGRTDLSKIAFDSMIDMSHTTAMIKGWWDDPDKGNRFGELIALVHSELSEALEEYRNGHTLTEIYYVKDENGNDKPEGVPIELVDAIIRIFDMAGYSEIDLFTAWLLKSKYNLTRSHRHGGKVI